MMKCGKLDALAGKILPSATNLTSSGRANGKNGQCQARSRSHSHIPRSLATVSKTQVPAPSTREPVANCPTPSGQTGTVRHPRLIEKTGDISHIPPSDPTWQQAPSPKLAHLHAVSHTRIRFLTLFSVKSSGGKEVHVSRISSLSPDCWACAH
jgi:hypothetical protein